MKCPKCGDEMEEGYFWITSGGWGANYWAKEEPPHWFRSSNYGEEKILESGVYLPSKKNWLRKGFRCVNCKLIAFEY